jgi:hypothetical protein
MESKVILKYKGFLDEFTTEKIEVIEHAIQNSVCRLIKKEHNKESLSMVISVCSDKILKLYDELKETDIQFEKDYQIATENASQQYSVFREMELILDLTAKMEEELKKTQSMFGFIPFVAL